VPAGANIPIVITSGKWRRQITVSNVASCSDTSLTAGEARLPKNKTEGDIPKIALTTGAYDSLECLIRKLGIDDAEITNSSGSGRVHFYRGNGVGQFVGTWPGGANATFTAATQFWNDVNKLMPYDIVILSCEGQQQPSSATKTQTDLNALKAYADLGGRVFTSHWHNIWIGGGFSANANNPTPVIPSWRAVASWNNNINYNNAITNIIDENSNPKGTSFANWMMSPGVMGSTVRTEIPVRSGTARSTASSIDTSLAERWTYIKQSDNNSMPPQNFQFTTPIEQPLGDRCGKVVFSDMHVSGGPTSGNYPQSCENGQLNPMTPQEKALAFMIFDISSCVGVLL
jgi:hypothetical protein